MFSSLFISVCVGLARLPLARPEEASHSGGNGVGIPPTLGCLSENSRTLLWTAGFGRPTIAWVVAK